MRRPIDGGGTGPLSAATSRAAASDRRGDKSVVGGADGTTGGRADGYLMGPRGGVTTERRMRDIVCGRVEPASDVAEMRG